MLKIAPSVLSADFSVLGDECRDVLSGGADWIHYDVMDGRFVPNISIGQGVLKSLSKAVPAFYDVHLMITDPMRYIGEFAKAGADMITFHVESEGEPREIIDAIHALGVKAGVTLKPATPVEAVLPYVGAADMVLVMSVEPGFGGQIFMPDMCAKAEAVRRRAKELGLDGYLIEMDGGIDPVTAKTAAASGINVFVAGSSVFGKADRSAAIRAVRASAEEGSECL